MSNALPYTQRQWEWIAQKHREGYSTVTLAKFLGVHKETVRRHLQQMGVLVEGCRSLPPLSKKEFYKLEGGN